MGGYLYLAIAITAEVIATTSMKALDGFNKPLPLLLVVVGYAISFWMLSLVVKTIPVGVAYGSDIDQVIACLMKISADHPNVCRDPEPRVRLRTFGDSSIGFELLVWIAEPVLRGLVLHELNCEVYRSFAREGIAIPFPQREVRLLGNA